MLAIVISRGTKSSIVHQRATRAAMPSAHAVPSAHGGRSFTLPAAVRRPRGASRPARRTCATAHVPCEQPRTRIDPLRRARQVSPARSNGSIDLTKPPLRPPREPAAAGRFGDVAMRPPRSLRSAPRWDTAPPYDGRRGGGAPAVRSGGRAPGALPLRGHARRGRVPGLPERFRRSRPRPLPDPVAARPARGTARRVRLVARDAPARGLLRGDRGRDPRDGEGYPPRHVPVRHLRPALALLPRDVPRAVGRSSTPFLAATATARARGAPVHGSLPEPASPASSARWRAALLALGVAARGACAAAAHLGLGEGVARRVVRIAMLE